MFSIQSQHSPTSLSQVFVVLLSLRIVASRPLACVIQLQFNSVHSQIYSAVATYPCKCALVNSKRLLLVRPLQFVLFVYALIQFHSCINSSFAPFLLSANFCLDHPFPVWALGFRHTVHCFAIDFLCKFTIDVCCSSVGNFELGVLNTPEMAAVSRSVFSFTLRFTLLLF